MTKDKEKKEFRSLTFRIDSRLKDGLREASMREHRTITNMIEVLIRNYCIENGIEVP